MKPRQQWRGFFVFRQKKGAPTLVLERMGSHTSKPRVGKIISRPRIKTAPTP